MRSKETLLRSLIREVMDDTLTGIFEDLILENILRDQLLKTSNHPNTTYSLVGDSNFVDLVYPVQVKALLDNSVISQIETSKVESTSPIGSNRSIANGRNISPKKEYWDTSVSPQKKASFQQLNSHKEKEIRVNSNDHLLFKM